jgi:hypothetical protein
MPVIISSIRTRIRIMIIIRIIRRSIIRISIRIRTVTMIIRIIRLIIIPIIIRIVILRLILIEITRIIITQLSVTFRTGNTTSSSQTGVPGRGSAAQAEGPEISEIPPNAQKSPGCTISGSTFGHRMDFIAFRMRQNLASDMPLRCPSKVLRIRGTATCGGSFALGGQRFQTAGVMPPGASHDDPIPVFS